MVQAQRHEHVLAPLLPPERVPALRAAVEKLADGGVGERLEGAEEARLAVPVAVLEVHALSAAVQGELPPQPAGHQHGVRVGLHDPVVVGPSAVALDHLPGVHEELRVSSGADVGDSDGGLREGQHRDVVAHADGLCAKHGGLVAIEDAGAEGSLCLDEPHLLWVEPRHHREAVERGGALRTHFLAGVGALPGPRPVKLQLGLKAALGVHAAARLLLDLSVAGVAPLGGAALARQGAARRAQPVDDDLELLERRRLREPGVPLGVHRDAVVHGPGDALVAWVAFGRRAAPVLTAWRHELRDVQTTRSRTS
mmetsp:Transcript_28886/g.76867  ORF Transcript_28886/g.76867 Transcript_28886/m.76867 type:complete len:310 (+) Transcript_28886:418-1347(+)